MVAESMLLSDPVRQAAKTNYAHFQTCLGQSPKRQLPWPEMVNFKQQRSH